MTIPSETLLVTLDVTSIYTNIPTEETIDCIIQYLKDFNQPYHPPIQILTEILKFIQVL